MFSVEKYFFVNIVNIQDRYEAASVKLSLYLTELAV